MKRGLLLKEQSVTGEMKVEKLMERFHAEEEFKLDFDTPLSNIMVNADGRFEHKHHGELNLTDSSFKQLCANMYGYTVPAEYMKNLYENDKDQFISIMNYHLSNSKESDKKIRTISTDEGTKVRGIVSTTYSPFDNLQALETFSRAMKNTGHDDYMLKTTNVRDNGMFLRFILPSTQKNFGESFEGKEDYNYVSLDLINGETGLSSLKVLASTYRLVCTNGMVALERVEGLTKRHTGDLSSIVGDMNLTINNGIVIAENALSDLEKSRNIVVKNPYEEIKKYATKGKLNEAQAKKVRENFEIEADKSLMGIVNAFTRTGRDLKDVDRRIEMERFANRILKTEISKVA